MGSATFFSAWVAERKKIKLKTLWKKNRQCVHVEHNCSVENVST